MKTFVIWDTCGADQLRFFIAEGDWSQLNEVFINSTDTTREQEEMINNMCLAAGIVPGKAMKDQKTVFSEFPVRKMLKMDQDQVKVIVCGFLP